MVWAIGIYCTYCGSTGSGEIEFSWGFKTNSDNLHVVSLRYHADFRGFAATINAERC